jgi:hypothetical protein
VANVNIKEIVNEIETRRSWTRDDLSRIGSAVVTEWDALRSALSPQAAAPQAGAAHVAAPAALAENVLMYAPDGPVTLTVPQRAEALRAFGDVRALTQRVSDLKFALGDGAGWFDRAMKAESALSSAQARVASLEADLAALREAMVQQEPEEETAPYKTWAEIALDYSEEIKLRVAAEKQVEHVSARLVSVEAERAALSKDVARLVGERDEYRDLLQSWKDAAARHAEQTAEILGLREERDRERAARELTEAERETFKQGWQGAEDRISELHRERDQERAARERAEPIIQQAVNVLDEIAGRREPGWTLAQILADNLRPLLAAPAIAPPPAEQETPQ